jgi:hypothetical protein
MLVAVAPMSNEKLYGLGIGPVIAALFVFKLERTVASGAEAQVVAAHGSVAVGVVKVATVLHGVNVISVGQLMIGKPLGLTEIVVDPVPIQPLLFTVTLYVVVVVGDTVIAAVLAPLLHA